MLKAVLSPLSKNSIRSQFHLKIFIELLTGKNLPSTQYIISNNLQAKDHLVTKNLLHQHEAVFLTQIDKNNNLKAPNLLRK